MVGTMAKVRLKLDGTPAKKPGRPSGYRPEPPIVKDGKRYKLDGTPAKPTGRPSSYRPEYVGQARRLCERGATVSDLAHFFEVSVGTIWNWSLENKAFLDILKLGKEVAD
jgi:hypothetical protein